MGDSFFDFTQYDIAESSLDEIASFSGNADSDLLIILRKTYLNDDNRQFLSKVIAATGRSLDDSIICSLDDNVRIRTSQIPNFQNYKYVIISGISPKEVSMALSGSHYTPINLKNQVILFIPNLTDIASDQNQKVNLWQSLKVIFDL